MWHGTDDESDTDEEDESQEGGAAVDDGAKAATANGKAEAGPSGSESVAKAWGNRSPFAS